MTTRTIIIESNRNISYKEELEDNPSNKPTNNNQNNRWKTYIPNGLLIETGDKINLEASMINAIGGGDEVMEFIGSTGLKVENKDLSDRGIALDLSYYITNRFQFNFNFPKSTVQLNYDVNSPEYGGPAFYSNSPTATEVDNFNAWEKNYPYQCLEGFSTDVTQTPRVYTPADPSLKPSYMKPPTSLQSPNNKRLYIGKLGYYGPYYTETNGDAGLFTWDKFTQRVSLETPTGFSTPSSISETLTSQLHQRFGNAGNWDNLTVEPLQFELNETTGIIKSNTLPAITDSTYLTFPTSTGRLFYERLLGEWSAKFAGEGQEVPEGTGYNINQGRFNFYRNIMTGRPEYYSGMTTGFSITQQKPCGSGDDLSGNKYQDFTVHTGQNTGVNKRYTVNTDYDVGLLGNNVCLLDNLPSQEANVEYYNSLLDRNETNTEAAVLDLEDGNGITTNIIWNADNLSSAVNQYIEKSLIVNRSTNTQDVRDEEFRKAHAIPFYFGRIDDQLSYGDIERTVYLAAPGLQIDPPPNGNDFRDSYLNQEITLDDGTTENVVALYGNVNNEKNEHFCYAFQYDNTFTPENANTNSITGLTNLYPHNTDSLFTTQHPENDLTKLKEIWNNLSILGNYGNAKACVVPVFYKDQASATANSSRTGENAYGVPFVCFIYQSSSAGNHPLPLIGEFCLWDTSLYNCDMSMISTTQKTGTGLYAQPDVANPEFTRPYQYMPFCFAGAVDTLINFDGGYSKFTMSQLHTSIKTGNGQYQNPTDPANSNPEQDIITINEREAHMCKIGDLNRDPIPYTSIVAFSDKLPVMSAQSGVGIERLFIPFNTGLPIENEQQFEITSQTIKYYSGSLLDKLGFSFEQVMPNYGFSQNQFNRGNYNRYLGYDDSVSVYQKELNMVKPFTTNAYISAAEQIALAQMSGVITTSVGNTIDIIVPSAKIGSCVLKQSSTNAISDLLIAKNLPRKLSYPYLVVYTDIVRNSDYYGGVNGHEKLNAISYITRNYAEGDYFYSFTTNWDYTADTDYIITSILTDIRLPDGRPAPIDENSSVIYKITKPKVMPLPPTIEIKKEEQIRREMDKDA